MLKAFQFEGTGSNFTAQDIRITNGSGPLYSLDNAWWNTAPQIFMRDANGAYSIQYFFLEDGIPNGDGTFSPGWVDFQANPVTDKIDVAQGFWILDTFNTAPKYTLAGQVVEDASYEATYTCADGYNLAANPYPMPFNPNDVAWTGLETAPFYSLDNEWWTTAPQIFVRDANGAYTDTYYYLADGVPNGDGTYSPGWVDFQGFPVTTAAIPAGDGFWFYNTLNTTVKAVFSK